MWKEQKEIHKVILRSFSTVISKDEKTNKIRKILWVKIEFRKKT